MTYCLSTATLLASTYGDVYDPTTEQPPHVLAENLDPTGEIRQVLDQQVQTWLSDAGDTSDSAMAKAVDDIGKALTNRFGQTYELQSSASTYDPIYSPGGTVVGHNTVAWVAVDGAYLFVQTTTEPTLGIYGCVFLSVRPI